MRILIITERFLPQRGGLAASAARIAKGLSDHNAEVHLFYVADDLPQGDLETGKWNDILTHRLGKFKEFDRTYMVAGRAIELLHQRHPFDAIIGMYIVNAGYLASMQGLELGVPSLVMARGNDIDREMWRSDKQPFVVSALKWATAVGGVSRELVEKCRLFAGREDAHWTPNSVDTDVFKPGCADPEMRMSLGLGKGIVVGFSGELRFKKGMHHLIEAAKSVSQTVSDARFLLVGGVRSDDREEFDSLLEEESAVKQIIVETPYVKDSQKLAEYYNLMDVLFLPSLWEGMPNAALEAMACGIPIVASDAGGLRDLIEHPKTGFLYPAGDLEAATETLIHALTMPGDIRRAMAARAREKVMAEFTPQKEIERVLAIITKIIGSNLKSGPLV